MSKAFFYIILTIFLVISAGYLLLGKNVESTSNKETDTGVISEGSIQKVILGMKNYNYYPNTIKVQAGKPVSITLDSSVAGCLRSFNIKDLGVSKYAKTPSETIDFTPTKKGTFRFACVMGMGYGTIIVE
jgi:plastocyanin domain-containing protein